MMRLSPPVLTALLVIALSLPARSDEALPIRMWLLHHYDMDYIRRMTDAAAEENVNYIQISHGIVHDVEDLLNDPRRQQDVPQMVDYAHERNLRVVMWTHELNAVPGEFRRDGKEDLSREDLWAWVRSKYERVFGELVAGLDGLVLTFHETQVSVYHDGRVESDLSRADRVTKLIDEVYSVCQKYGKELYVRTFVYRPDELEWVIEGIGNSDPRVRVMTKCVPHDWQPFYPHNPAFGRFPDRVQIMEMDLAGEYYGQAVVPYCFPEYVKYRLDYGRSRGISGAVARVDRHSNSAIDTPNWVNVMAFDRLLLNPELSTDEIWREYSTRFYGEKAAPTTTAVLKRTKHIIEQMYLVDHFYFLNQHSSIPSLSYADSHITSHSPAKWAPETYSKTQEEMLRPAEETYERVMAEKHRALELARSAISELEGGRSAFSREAYVSLRGRMERLFRCARLWEPMTDAYFRRRILMNRPTLENLGRAETALQGFRNEIAYLETLGHHGSSWDDASKAQRLADQIERSIRKIEIPE